jgi:hypothetical protein
MTSVDGYVMKSNDIVWRMYDGEAVLMSEDGSQIHMLNNVASFIWELVDGKTTVGDIVTQICDRFDVEKDIAQADAVEFIQQLAEKNLLGLISRTSDSRQ